MSLRVLTVSNCPLDPNLGSGRMILGFAERLRARGHEVTLLGPERYEWLPRLRAGKRLRMLAGYSQATMRAMRERTFDVVELWGAEGWWVMSQLARRALRPVLVARSNGLEPHFEQALARHGLGAPAARLGRALDRWQRRTLAFRDADLLTVVSDFDRRFALEQRYQPEERLLTLENPLDEDVFAPAPASIGEPLIGYFGSATANKGAALLLAALISVLEQRPKWRARIVGANQLAATPLPPSISTRVAFHPFVADRARLLALYRETAITALPSAYESFGLVAAEAMASGSLLVASPVGFAAGLSATEAVLVRERTVAAWAQALQNATDDNFNREEIARAGAHRARALRWEPTVERLITAYERLRTSRVISPS